MIRQMAIVLLAAWISSCFCGCDQPQPKKATKSNWPYKFLRSKAEGGNKNIMRLYCYDGKFNQASLVEFCREQKRASKAEAFLFIVIFDDVKNATFPDSPFTAQFGVEEHKLRHIRAFYEYNRVNGFSELRVFDTNMWEGKPTTIKL
jgi:hypothetical protein